jgi:hypothetical protein
VAASSSSKPCVIMAARGCVRSYASLGGLDDNQPVEREGAAQPRVGLQGNETPADEPP